MSKTTPPNVSFRNGYPTKKSIEEACDFFGLVVNDLGGYKTTRRIHWQKRNSDEAALLIVDHFIEAGCPAIEFEKYQPELMRCGSITFKLPVK